MNAELGAWLSGGAALAVALVAWFPWMRANLNHEAFVTMVKRLLAADNAERARKLCKAAPGVPFVMACDAALAALADTREEPASETVVRLREAFDGTLRKELARVSSTAWIAMIAVALGGVAVYLVVGEGASPYALALVGMSLIVIMHARQIGMQIAIAGGTHRDPLIEIMAATLKKPAKA